MNRHMCMHKTRVHTIHTYRHAQKTHVHTQVTHAHTDISTTRTHDTRTYDTCRHTCSHNIDTGVHTQHTHVHTQQTHKRYTHTCRRQADTRFFSRCLTFLLRPLGFSVLVLALLSLMCPFRKLLPSWEAKGLGVTCCCLPQPVNDGAPPRRFWALSVLHLPSATARHRPRPSSDVSRLLKLCASLTPTCRTFTIPKASSSSITAARPTPMTPEPACPAPLLLDRSPRPQKRGAAENQ